MCCADPNYHEQLCADLLRPLCTIAANDCAARFAAITAASGDPSAYAVLPAASSTDSSTSSSSSSSTTLTATVVAASDEALPAAVHSVLSTLEQGDGARVIGGGATALLVAIFNRHLSDAAQDVIEDTEGFTATGSRTFKGPANVELLWSELAALCTPLLQSGAAVAAALGSARAPSAVLQESAVGIVLPALAAATGLLAEQYRGQVCVCCVTMHQVYNVASTKT
jgi:hypothetical protein